MSGFRAAHGSSVWERRKELALFLPGYWSRVFTGECRRCVEAAVEEARMLGHDPVGDEDLLLGILRR